MTLSPDTVVQLTMFFQPHQRLLLLDRHNRDLGVVTITRLEDDLVFGQFVVGADYPAHAQLFADYVEAAKDQLLSVVGDLDAVIAGLGLYLRSLEGLPTPSIHDVQIGSDIITFRIGPRLVATSPAGSIETGSSHRTPPVS